jgi:tetratricopeptide (TPR) repeat protein
MPPTLGNVIRKTVIRKYRFAGGLLAAGLALTVGWSGLASPLEPLSQIRRDLAELGTSGDADAESAALALAADGNFSQALAIARSIQSEPDKALTLQAIATIASELGAADTVLTCLQEALAAAKVIPPGDEYWTEETKPQVFSVIAFTANELGEPSLAQAALQEAIALTKRIQPEFGKAEALRAIAVAAGTFEDAILAQPILEEVLAIAKPMQEEAGGNGLSKGLALRAIACTASELGEASLAQATLQEALAFVKTIQDEFSRADFLREIAFTAGEFGDASQARPVLWEAIATMQTIQDEDAKPLSLGAIAASAAKIGDWELVALATSICRTDSCLTQTQADALRAQAEQRNPALAERYFQSQSPIVDLLNLTYLS